MDYYERKEKDGVELIELWIELLLLPLRAVKAAAKYLRKLIRRLR